MINMYISKLTMENFKSFKGKHVLEFAPKINYFVGNNNCGKTSIFHAIQFIISRGKKEDFISIGANSVDNVAVEIVLQNVKLPKSSKYYSYLEESQFRLDKEFTLNKKVTSFKRGSLKLKNKRELRYILFQGLTTKLIKVGKLTLQRSSKSEKIQQNGRTKILDIKTVRVWNFTKKQFENPTGADTTITEIFDPQFIYADLRNEDLQDFGSTKPIGGLIKSISSDFQQQDIYKEFQAAHSKAFGPEGILSDLDETQKQINEKITEQFGESKVHFSFDLPTVTDFLKKGTISITENNIKTEASEKGSGMQRALALAIIQILADNNSKIDSSLMQFFIDEPEIFLHPQAQDKLLNSLKLLAHSQIFITTHSPYVLRHFRNKKIDSINILSNQTENRISTVDTLMFGKPSIGEVTYKAFNVPTVDFHQQLFTHLYLKWIENYKPKNSALASFDDYLTQTKKLDKLTYTPRVNGEWKKPQERSLPYIVRNQIDHPEILEGNKNIWSEDKLRKSIEIMLELRQQSII